MFKNILKSDAQIVEEIHHEFDTAEDRLLSSAEELLQSINIQTETSLEQKAERLAKVGFVNTPVVKKAGKIKERNQELQKTVVSTKEQAELIRYYKQNYPFQKFLTEDELDRICTKYGLVYSAVDRYIKEVPEKNLREIENAQGLRVEDANPILEVYTFSQRSYDKVKYAEAVKLFGGNRFTKEQIDATYARLGVKKPYASEIFMEDNYTGMFYHITDKLADFGDCVFADCKSESIDRGGLYIAAPPSHFDLEGKTKKGLGFFDVTVREVKDPIVFRYVKGGIQVITKWGLEAEDPALLNEIHN